MNEYESNLEQSPTNTFERMDMITKGYNPLSEEDIENYRSKSAPTVGNQNLIEGMGEYSFNSLGERNMSSMTSAHVKNSLPDDVSKMSKEERENGIMSADTEVKQATRNFKSDLKNSMDHYDSPATDLNARLQNSIQSKTKQPTKKRQLTESPDQASKKGFNAAVKYLNAFSTLIKNPSEQNRNTFLEHVNNMLTIEESYLNDKNHGYFQSGLGRAEAKMCKILYKQK
jgi:t-SNARE complex subunit (syntaxin)